MKLCANPAINSAFSAGYTYTGHPVAAAAALKALEIYRRERLFEHAGRRLHAKPSAKYESHPLVGEVRGKGLIAAIELVANKAQRKSFSDGKVGAQPNSTVRIMACSSGQSAATVSLSVPH